MEIVCYSTNMATPHGIVEHSDSPRPTDYLFRVSLKCVVFNAFGEVLAVKERGRDWWDLPGGGMDHGETITGAIARELREEVSLEGAFAFEIITAEDPVLLTEHGFWQLRLVVSVTPKSYTISPGIDADEVQFVDPKTFKNAKRKTEAAIYTYARLATSKKNTPSPF